MAGLFQNNYYLVIASLGGEGPVLEYASKPAFWWLGLLMAATFSAFIAQTPTYDDYDEEREKKKAARRKLADAGGKKGDEPKNQQADKMSRKGGRSKAKNPSAAASEDKKDKQRQQEEEAEARRIEEQEQQFREELEQERRLFNYNTATNPRYTLFLHSRLANPSSAQNTIRIIAALSYLTLFACLAVELSWLTKTELRLLPNLKLYPKQAVDTFLGPRPEPFAELFVHLAAFTVTCMGTVAGVAAMGCALMATWYPIGCAAEVLRFDAATLRRAEKERQVWLKVKEESKGGGGRKGRK